MKLIRIITLGVVLALGSVTTFAMDTQETTLAQSSVRVAVVELAALGNSVIAALGGSRDYPKIEDPQALKKIVETLRSTLDTWHIDRIQSIVDAIPSNESVSLLELSTLKKEFSEAYSSTSEYYKLDTPSDLKNVIIRLRNVLDNWHNGRITSIANPLVIALGDSKKD